MNAAAFPAGPAAQEAADARPVGRAHVVVEGQPLAGAASATPAGAERQAARRQLRAAGQASAWASLPLPGALLLAVWPLGSWTLAMAAHAAITALWSLLTLVVAAALMLSRVPAITARWSQAPWPAAVAAGALCLACLPWLAEPALRQPLAAMAMAWALTTAHALSPWRRLAGWLALLPALACLGAAASLSPGLAWPWALAGLLGAAATLAVAWLGHRGWHRRERQALAAEARMRTLEAERDLALRAEQEKSRFVAIASHDLRQPVHALGLFAATLQKRLQHTPDEPLLRNFMRAVDDLERSFSAMLDISRLDSGAQTSAGLHTFALRDLFRRLHMQYAGQAELSGLGLRFSTGGKSVTSDPQLLERIIGNLIQNALKFTSQGGVVVVARSTATHVNVEVWDTGVGIPAEELPRVFQEFYQLAPGKRDRSHGLGMGLAIVKRLAQLLGHRLEVASRPGKGTMFRVGIPIGALPGIQDELAPADTVPMAVDTPQMVLIVDDEEPIREGLRVLLQAWGYQTMTAANAAEAEQAVLALGGRVDLVLSDLQLASDPSEPDGCEVVERIRQLCGYPVPAVLVTGDTSPQALQRLAERGHPVLYKPVQPRRLFDAMGSALGREGPSSN